MMVAKTRSCSEPAVRDVSSWLNIRRGSNQHSLSVHRIIHHPLLCKLEPGTRSPLSLAQQLRDLSRKYKVINDHQDETSLTAGSEHERILAPVGYQRPVYHLGGDSRDHTSLSTIISGDGKYIGCRIVYKGVRK